MKMDINNFKVIYLSIMDEFHQIIYLIQIINEIHSYGIIHLSTHSFVYVD
jgi:hypothetical protein